VALMAALGLAALAGPSYAVRPDEMLSDPVLEARAEAVSREIRCVVCQSQSVDESDADVAHDIRVLIREQIKAGASDADVKAFLVARYGDFVLLQPPFKAKTLLIWIGPFALLAGAGIGVCLFLRRGTQREAAPLNATEQARLDKFLKSHDDVGGGGA
jgi:cytochrome c-type biogenesis protein CcmH